MKDEKDLQYASLNQMYNELDEMYHAVAVAHKISDCALWILYCVRETSAPLTQSEIADAMFINRQSVNSALRKMEEEGYIVLRTKEDNRKNKCILLTEKGERLASVTADLILRNERAAFERFEKGERAAFERFEKGERAAFVALNRRYVDAVKELFKQERGKG